MGGGDERIHRHLRREGDVIGLQSELIRDTKERQRQVTR